MHLNVVVLPAPFNPNKPKHSPGLIAKFKFLIAIISLFFDLQQKVSLNIFYKIFILNI